MYNRRRPAGPDPLLILIGVNVVIYILSLFRDDLPVTFGLNPTFFPEEPWTLLTHMFFHAGLFHIMFNMLALFFLGNYLLRLVGNLNFLIIYFGGGILGGLLYVLLGDPFSIAIGASGAVFALGGTMAVLTPNARVMIFPVPAPMPMWIAIIIIFVVSSFLLSSVAWEGHLGGLVFGLGAGLLLRNRRQYYR